MATKKATSRSKTSSKNKPRAKKSATPKASAKTPAKTSKWRKLFKVTFYLGLLASLVLLGYLIYLDRTITKTFEGRRWSVPAQVFAQPLELHAGLDISQAGLQIELERLGYKPNTQLSTPGTFYRRGNTLEIYLRAFHFMERIRDSQKISVSFRGGYISKILSHKDEIPLIRLDPATIGSFFPSHGEDRIILTPDQVPPLLSAGLKAIEDRNFDRHAGFSLTGIFRALMVNIRAGERQQGGSTLTQQLVKSYFLDNRRTIERKLQELAMSIILEIRFSKEDLLTAYINEIFIGQNGARAIHGFGLGAQFYFNKPISELNVDEIATLISVIRGPSYYNPFRHPKRARDRRDRILATFRDDQLISASDYQTSVNKSLGVIASPTRGGAYYPAFMDKVRAELKQTYNLEQLSSEGLRIFTTIKPRTQESVQSAVTANLAQIENDRRIEVDSLQAAALIADSQTGDIVALVGGRRGRVDGFNRALSAKRPVGSLIKPVVYLTALESGMHLASPVKDDPITLEPEYGDVWSPKNFDGKFRGELPLYRALAESLNLATVNLGMQIGLDNIQARFAQLTGSKVSNPYPSFLLGAESRTPIEMLQLYSNFASGGFRTEPRAVISVLNEEGAAISHHPFELVQSIRDKHVGAINRALEITMAMGTGRSSPHAKKGIAGKTGTSNDNRDSWFAGYDNRHVSVVWVGKDNNDVTGLTGTSGALRIWNRIAEDIAIDPLVHLPEDNMLEIEYTSGLQARQSCADVIRLPFPKGTRLDAKPGCGIKPKLGERLKKWFGR